MFYILFIYKHAYDFIAPFYLFILTSFIVYSIPTGTWIGRFSLIEVVYRYRNNWKKQNKHVI